MYTMYNGILYKTKFEDLQIIGSVLNVAESKKDLNKWLSYRDLGQ